MKKSISVVSLFLSIALLTSVAYSQGRMIALDSNRSLYDVDITTGAKTQFGAVSANAGTTAGLAYDAATGTVYLTSTTTDSLYTLDLATGNATLVGAYGDSTVVMHGLEFDATTNSLYGGSNGNLFSINKTTGLATQIGSSGLSSFLNLVHDSHNNVMYATNSGADSFYSVNRNNGSMALIGPLNGSTNPNGLAYNSDNDTIYMIDNTTDSFYSIDRTSGAANLIGAMGSGNLLGLVYIPVPEPSCLLAIGMALTTLLVGRRR